MPVRIATGPFDGVANLKTILSAQPSTIEDGFRILETDLPTSDADTIDLLGIDQNSLLTIIALASGGPDHCLLKLLDQYRWALRERHLLARAYPQAASITTRTIRCLLLAPTFTHRFLERLSLLAVEVTPCRVRRLDSRREVSLLVEPVSAIVVAEKTGRAEMVRDEPAGVPRGEFPAALGTAQSELDKATHAEPQEVAPFPWEAEREADAVPEISVDEPDVSEPAFADVLDELPSLDTIRVDGVPVEPLTAEEFEEFERFDMQRRARERSPS